MLHAGGYGYDKSSREVLHSSSSSDEYIYTTKVLREVCFTRTRTNTRTRPKSAAGPDFFFFHAFLLWYRGWVVRTYMQTFISFIQHCCFVLPYVTFTRRTSTVCHLVWCAPARKQGRGVSPEIVCSAAAVRLLTVSVVCIVRGGVSGCTGWSGFAIGR